jgi:hypothetical protein
MPKTSIFVVRHEREALSDGRVVEKVHIDLKGKSDWDWHCVCPPGDKHNHDALIGEIAAKVANRQEIVGPLNALVGTKIGEATITDCQIQIRAPKIWPLYVAWEYADNSVDVKVWDAEDPLKAPHPDEVVAYIQSVVDKRAAHQEAAQKAERFE